MFVISYGAWTASLVSGGLPYIYDDYVRHAALVDEFNIKGTEGSLCYIGVSSPTSTRGGWPEIVVAQRYEPDQVGFYPGLLIAPDTETLFIGAGTRLLAYNLSPPLRIWEDSTNVGFWKWQQHGDVILMSAEIELGAWSADGEKLWTTFVEPPWSYTVDGNRVGLDVMGRMSSFDISTGPAAG